ncbi:MAG: hypothetical protein KUG65_01845, partial [Sphingomonadaceae bacterium]|nr:hypothetical protein [Sphingomonadaceae bacterium]
AIARQLLLARPLPAENHSVLAIAAAKNGERELAVRALGLSAGRGWREPLAQTAAAQGALEVGDHASAARRSLALWSIGQRTEATVSLLDRSSMVEAGRAEIARWLGASDVWRDEYLVWGARNLPFDGHGKTAAHAIAAGASFDCAKLGETVVSWLNRGAVAAANATWAGPCARGLRGPGDFAFTPVAESGNAGPFGWHAVNAAGFAIDREAKKRRWNLSYDNRKPGSTRVAVRMAALAPGAYEISFSEQREAGTVSLPVRMGMICIDASGRSASDVVAILGRGAKTLNIPATGCAAQRFWLTAPRGRGSISQLSLMLPN